MAAVTRRALAAGLGSTALAASACARRTEPVSDPLLVDDQSRLNAVRVSRNLALAASPLALEAEARLVLTADAAPVCIGGARHSMGGQSLPPAGGVAAALGRAVFDLDRAGRAYSATGGARWRDVIRTLDPHGLSPAVTQSNNDFTVGGSISVNAHGWAAPRGPVGSTVRRLRLMLADGQVVTCSPTENPDLLALVLGGYGLFGVILDAQIEAADNLLLNRRATLVEADAFAPAFVRAVHEPEVRMAYGRLSLHREAFLKEAVLVRHRVAPEQPADLPAAAGAGPTEALSRRVFRGQTGSDAGKVFRWWAETHLPAAGKATRNSLLNAPVASFAGSDLRRTDILHEYFVPPDALAGFLADCRRLIPASDQDLLNVTLRWIEADPRSVLSFAPAPRVALVMLFSQSISADAERDMTALTRRLIDAALAAGGGFYLPYRLHARPDQLSKAYPRLPEFVAAKRRLDPGLRFRNVMWDRWFARV